MAFNMDCDPYTSTRSESTKPGLARPVRMPPSECLNTSTAFSMRSSLSNRMSSAFMALTLLAGYQRPHFFARHGALYVALFAGVEHDDRHIVFHTLGDRGGIHHAEILFANGIIMQVAVE